MTAPDGEQVPDEPAIVWWPWGVLAAGPAVAVVLASVGGDPDDGGSSVLALVIVAALAVLLLGAVFAPALVLISRQRDAPQAVRERSGAVFVICVLGAHVVGQVIDRLGPDGGESAPWALAFIGVYVAASAIAWTLITRVQDLRH